MNCFRAQERSLFKRRTCADIFAPGGDKWSKAACKPRTRKHKRKNGVTQADHTVPLLQSSLGKRREFELARNGVFAAFLGFSSLPYACKASSSAPKSARKSIPFGS